MAENIFRLQHNQQPIEPGFVVIDGGEFTGQILPKDEWPTIPSEITDATLELFKTPIDEFTDLEEELDKRKDEVVRLGELETHVVSADTIAVTLEVGNLYDVFCVAQREDGTRFMFGGGRYATAEEPDYEVSRLLTFEETKFFALAGLGLTIERAKDAAARVSPMTAWGKRFERYVIAGFNLYSDEAIGSEPGVSVQHNGIVDFYHGMNAAETVAAATV